MSEVVGIDLGSYALKCARVMVNGSKSELVQLANVYNPVGQFLPTDQGLFSKLAETIKTFFTENHLRGKQVNLAVPESLAYTSVINMPYLSDAELASSIHWEAEQHIPVPIDEINLEYEVLYKPRKDEVAGKMRVLLVGARKEMIERLVLLFKTAGVEVVGLETVLLGSYRSLLPALTLEGAAIVVHIGALTTDILITHNGELVLTYTIQTGGLAFTRAIEKGLELPPSQAEEYKRAYGLDPGQLEGRVRQVLTPVLNIMISEIKKAMQYYQSAHVMSPIRRMVVSGGSAYLPGLPAFLAETFSFELLVANPLETVTVKSGLKMPVDIASYVPAIGLANHVAND